MSFPEPPSVVMDLFENKSFLKELNLINSNEVEEFRRFYGRALVTGRPLNSAMIFMAGMSGSGKSSTINALFNDPSLCKTNSSSAETKDPVILRKTLHCSYSNSRTPKLVGHLDLVDVAGAFDTNSKIEAENLAKIRKFTQSKIGLKSRAELMEKYSGNICRRVFPNLVLCTVNATDNRINGPDSFFRKTLEILRETQNIVDKYDPNLIMVLTHASALPRRRENFIDELEEKVKIIREIVEDVLEISNVDVLPVENNPQEYDLKKEGNFYKLPNGELSHSNLYKAMIKRLAANGDLLGHRLVDWYFDPDPEWKCSARELQADRIKPNLSVGSTEISLAGEDLRNLNLYVDDGCIVPEFSFQSLGYGYCPVTEETKPVNLLSRGKHRGSFGDQNKKRQVVKINEAKFQIPEGVQAFKEKASCFRKLSFYKKEDYEEHKMNSYGLDVGYKLIVKASAKGRWMRSSGVSSGTSVLSMIQEVKVANLRIINPSESVANEAFLSELEDLPEDYDEDDKEAVEHFQGFFAKWGSHLIYEQSVGGAIHLNCSLKETSHSESGLEEIEMKIGGVFKFFCGGAEGAHAEQRRGFGSAGISKVDFEIVGGEPPAVTSVEEMDARNYRTWAESVQRNPVELRRSMKLYPYYHLFNSGSDQYKSLRKATLAHMKDTLEAKICRQLAEAVRRPPRPVEKSPEEKISRMMWELSPPGMAIGLLKKLDNLF